MPVSIFQDIQQEDFWSVGVRSFGHSLLYLKALKQGTRVWYTVTRDVNGKILDWSFASGHRIQGQHPAVFELGRLTGKMHQLQLVVSLKKGERSALAFGQAFMNSSKLYAGFYDQGMYQIATVNQIMNLFQNPSPGVRYVLSELIQFVGAAVDNHELMINAILTLENTDQVKFADRRKNLLVWNRGTRIFVKELSSHSSTAHLGFSADEPTMRLEKSRLLLLSPEDASATGSPDAQETLAIQEAHHALSNPAITNDPVAKQKLLMDCQAWINEEGCSILGRCVAKIVTAFLHKDVAAARLNADKILAFSEGVPPPWKKEINIWETVARELANSSTP